MSPERREVAVVSRCITKMSINGTFTSYRTLINAIRDTFDTSAGHYRRFDRSQPTASDSKSTRSASATTVTTSASNSSHHHQLDASSHSTSSASSASAHPHSPSHSPPATNMSSAAYSRGSRKHASAPAPAPACTSYTLLLALAICQLLLLHQGAAAQICGYPGSPAHAIVSMSPQGLIQAGTTATYNCDNGYELLGPARRTCNENGTWTPLGIPFCVLNVAVGKAAMQSSSVGQGTAQKAIDGSTSTFFNPSTCSMTEAEAQPWFYVNLLEPVLVQLVRIDFGASCCGRSPATITVRVGNYRPDMGQNPVCNKFTGYIEEGRPLFLPCARPMPGAFVSITLESNGNPLSICEMFVYTDHALSIEQCPSFRDQPLGSTSTYNGNCYIFYNHQQMNFPQAKTFCEKRGGSLVNQISPALQGFLSWELYRRHKNDKHGQYWLGVVRDTQNAANWKWINGKDVTLSFWNLPGTQENCSRFDGTKGFLWSDTNCNSKLNFMCQHRPLSCGKPERPVNSTVLAASTDVGATIEYRCGDGSLLIGPSIRTCLPNGFFSEFAPKCKFIECGFPASIVNGHYTLNNGSSRAFLSTLSYHCKEGYVLVGQANLKCDADGRWNGPPPRCEPVLCPLPPLIVNGAYSLPNNNSTMFGSAVEYLCDPGYELVGERIITCNMAGYWDAQPGYCLETATPPPPTTTTTPSTTTASTTAAATTTTNPPTTFQFAFNRNTGGSSGGSNSDVQFSSVTKRPTIALLPTSATSSSSSSVNTNPYTRGEGGSSSSSSSSSFVPNTTPLSTTSNNVRPSGQQKNSHNNRQQSSSRPMVPTSSRPGSSSRIPYEPPHLNEIPSSDSKIRSPTVPPFARLNMGGIIALGVFGGFVFLAAVITIIVIIIRRVKHSHSSLDAQTISTFDSSNGDNPGFYHKYASAWSQLQSQSAAVLHSGSYKPSLAAGRLEPYEAAAHHHYVGHNGHRAANGGRTNNNNGTVNEGFRDSNEITLNADVYTRSSSGGSGSSSEHKRYSGKARGSGDHEWQHLTRAKY